MKKWLSTVLCIFQICSHYSQENKMGIIQTHKGNILFYDLENDPFTIYLEGKTEIKNYPLIINNNKGFQLIQNVITSKNSSTKQILEDYKNSEITYLEKYLPKQVSFQSEILSYESDIMQFWYYTNPVVDNAPKEVIPYQMTFFLDWRVNNKLYRLSYHSLNKNITEAKNFLLQLRKNIHYYKNPLNLDKLYNESTKGKFFYKE